MRVYHIPANFAQEGVVLGTFKTRNFIEAAVLAIGAVVINYYLPIGIKGHVYVAIFTVVPLALVGLLGIKGMSLTQFVGVFVRYMRSRDVYKEPNAREKIARQKRLMKEQAKEAQKKKKRK